MQRLQWWMFGLGLETIVLLIALVFIVNLIIQGFFLGIGLGFVNGRNRDIGSTFGFFLENLKNLSKNDTKDSYNQYQRYSTQDKIHFQPLS
jgi:hypothetical protein